MLRAWSRLMMRSDSRVAVACGGCNVTRRVYVRADGSLPAFCWPCSLKRRGGALNGRWAGGITPANKKIRASNEYKAWRTAVFERDKYTCIWCGNRGSLHADHIEPFSTYPALRFELGNGRTLCLECHQKTPSYLAGALKGRYSRRDPKLRPTACSKCARPYDLWDRRGWARCRACRNKNWLRRHYEKHALIVCYLALAAFVTDAEQVSEALR